MRKVIIFASLMAILLVPVVAAAVEKASRITDREIVERLTRLEEGQKAFNRRFDDLRAEMNGRFQAMDKRFDTLQWMLGLFITISLVILGFVLRMQWQMQKRQTVLETTLTAHKDELAFLKNLIEKLLPPKGVL
jgi:multidrug efflux pump subunit AcrB